MFVDLDLAKRLEFCEGNACLDFAVARKRLDPASTAQWFTDCGAIAVFDGPSSPLTQTFGLGLMGSSSIAEALEQMEAFYFSRNVPADHEVSPFAGIATLQTLCNRGYRPIEISSVLYQSARNPDPVESPRISVRLVDTSEADLWGEVSAGAWSLEHPEFHDFVLDMGKLSVNRERTYCFLAELDGQPAATAILYTHEGAGLFSGSSTLPTMRRNGLQAALLNARMRHASSLGCDLFMMVAEPGSASQRNAQRSGFAIAYTRNKWQLLPPGSITG